MCLFYFSIEASQATIVPISSQCQKKKIETGLNALSNVFFCGCADGDKIDYFYLSLGNKTNTCMFCSGIIL